VTLSNAHVAATDPETAAAQLTWTVSGLSGGRFEYAAAPGVAITTFTQADIDAWAVRFVHDGNEAPPAYALTLSDAATTVGPNGAAVTYTNQDDAPVVALNSGANLAQGESVTITNAMLRSTDVDTPAAQLVFELTGLPAHGTLLLDGRPLGAGDVFTQADVDAGLLAYRHDRATAARHAFIFRASDASTTLANASFALVVTATPAPPTVPAPQLAPAAPSVSAPAEPEPVAAPMAQIEAAPQSRAEPTASAPQPLEKPAAQPSASPAGTADAAVHPLATVPAHATTAEDAGVRMLAGPADIFQRLDRIEAAPVASWSARVSVAPASLPLFLLNWIGEAQAASTESSIDMRIGSGQPSGDVLLELEQVRNRIEEQFAQNRTVVASTIAVSTGLSVGYVLWLVRGGLLLTSVLSALPAWQIVDPLPVLGTMKRAQDDPDAGDDALEGLFQRSHPRPHPRPDNAASTRTARDRLAEEVEA
ncbi:MAG: cadherin-like domain-containing protein, partial [Burkholderiales bacterium]